MPDPTVLERLVADVARQIRLRRAEFYGLRGLLWALGGRGGAARPRSRWGSGAIVGAATLLLAGAGAGALRGFLMTLPPAEAARLADRGYGLQERVSHRARVGRSGGPHADRGGARRRHGRRAPTQLGARRIIPRRVPREAKFVPAPPRRSASCWPLAPPIPLPAGRPAQLLGLARRGRGKGQGPRRETCSDRSGRQAARRDPVQRADVQERTLTPRMGGGGQSQPGDLAAVFKDTSLAGRGARLQLLPQEGRRAICGCSSRWTGCPIFSSDFTQNQTRAVFQKAKALRGGLDPNKKVSPEKLRELLQRDGAARPEAAGGGQSDWAGDIYEGMEALEGGQSDKAMEAMERALNKMRSMEERGRDGKGAQGRPRERPPRRPARERDAARVRAAPGDEGDFPEGEGLLPGTGQERHPEGRSRPQRLRAQSVRRGRGG